jgi:hypothetical protein
VVHHQLRLQTTAQGGGWVDGSVQLHAVPMQKTSSKRQEAATTAKCHTAYTQLAHRGVLPAHMAEHEPVGTEAHQCNMVKQQRTGASTLASAKDNPC